jgi:hypothetical protein
VVLGGFDLSAKVRLSGSGPLFGRRYASQLSIAAFEENRLRARSKSDAIVVRDAARFRKGPEGAKGRARLLRPGPFHVESVLLLRDSSKLIRRPLHALGILRRLLSIGIDASDRLADAAAAVAADDPMFVDDWKLVKRNAM